MPRYEGDPRRITARFGYCAKCKQPLAGKPAVFFPHGKVCFCEKCGAPEMATFEAAAQDEAVMTGNY